MHACLPSEALNLKMSTQLHRLNNGAHALFIVLKMLTHLWARETRFSG